MVILDKIYNAIAWVAVGIAAIFWLRYDAKKDAKEEQKNEANEKVIDDVLKSKAIKADNAKLSTTAKRQRLRDALKK